MATKRLDGGQPMDDEVIVGRAGKNPDKQTGIGAWIRGIGALLVVVFAIWGLDLVFVKSMLAKRGASVLASYLAVGEIYVFVLSLIGFTMLGVMALLGRTSGAGDDAASGRLVKQSLGMAVVTGVLGTVCVLAAHEQLLHLFKPRGEDAGDLVAGARADLLVRGSGFVLGALLNVSVGIMTAGSQLEMLAILAFTARARRVL